MFNIGGYGYMMPGSMYNTGHMDQYFKSKYGCEDCLRTQPYLQEYPKPIMPLAKESVKPSFFARLFNKIIG